MWDTALKFFGRAFSLRHQITWPTVYSPVSGTKEKLALQDFIDSSAPIFSWLQIPPCNPEKVFFLEFMDAGGAVASWFRALDSGLIRAGDILLCSWARHFILTVPLSTQVYKWVQAN